MISIFVNVVGSESAMLFGNYAYFPVIGLFLFVTIRTLKKSLASSTTPLMYGTICAYAVTSLIAQTIWTYDEIYLKIETYPSLADVFYLIGCSALLMFFVEYLYTLRIPIAKKNIALCMILPISILAVVLFFGFEIFPNENIFEGILASIYPIIDTIVVIPAVIGIMVPSIRQHGSALLFFGVATLFVADIAFFYAENLGLYYTGYIWESFFYFSYVFLAFGTYNLMALSTTKIQNQHLTKKEHKIRSYDHDNSNKFSLYLERIDLLPWSILVTAMVFTVILFVAYNDYVRESTKTEFENDVKDIVDKIEKRMAHYGEVLQAARGLFAASKTVERDEWKQFIETQRIQERFSGIQGVGFQKQTSDYDVYLKDMEELRNLGLLNRTPPVIHPDGYYRYIFYLEPVNERNKQAYGYDMFSEPIRREAIERSRDRDSPALSGKVTLVQEITEEKQAGFLLYLPVYQNDKPHNTVEERNVAIIGNVYEPFRTDDFMDGIVTEKLIDMDFQIFDNVVTDKTLLYDYNNGFESTHTIEPIFTKSIFINNYGRTWILQFNGYSDLIPTTSIIIAYSILIVGLLFSIFLFFITRHIRKTNRENHNKELESEIMKVRHHTEIENLERINKLKTEFTSMISHELKTPLVSIQGYAELLDMELKNLPKEQREEIHEIRKNAITLNSIINDLLDTQKLELKKIELYKSQVDVNKLIQNTVSNFKPMFDQKSVLHEIKINEHLILYCDEFRIKQVLTNLIKNAVEAINHNNGMIILSVKKESGEVVFSIKDNGIGMTKTQLDNLFKKFYQADTSLSRKKGGSGLGLYISNELVTIHGGRMWVESESDKGSTFYFTIPL